MMQFTLKSINFTNSTFSDLTTKLRLNCGHHQFLYIAKFVNSIPIPSFYPSCKWSNHTLISVHSLRFYPTRCAIVQWDSDWCQIRRQLAHKRAASVRCHVKFTKLWTHFVHSTRGKQRGAVGCSASRSLSRELCNVKVGMRLAMGGSGKDRR